jgi:hypothetical protein
LWALSDAESRELTAAVAGLRNTAEAAYLRAVRDLDSRPSAVAGARPGKVAKTFLELRLRRSRAGADVAAAHALDTDLPLLADALTTGEVSREHVDSAVRTLTKVPGHFRESDRARQRIDAWLTQNAREFAPIQADKCGRALLDVLDPDGLDRFDPNAIERRELSVVTDSTGMVLIRGQLDQGTGAPLLALLDHLAKPTPRSKDELPVPDQRSRGQRYADALGVVIRLALGALGKGSEVDRPRVVIHAPLYGPVAESEQTGPIPERWLARHLCDAVLQAALIGRKGDVLNVGRAQRTVTPVQRRALIARDGGCVIPGCHAPGAWCDGHHVRWWSKGGRTDIANLALLCPRHHTDVHAGIWSLEVRNGLPWARPPTWLDPQQRWRRNTYRHHRDAAHQLRLDLDPPPDDGVAA